MNKILFIIFFMGSTATGSMQVLGVAKNICNNICRPIISITSRFPMPPASVSLGFLVSAWLTSVIIEGCSEFKDGVLSMDSIRLKDSILNPQDANYNNFAWFRKLHNLSETEVAYPDQIKSVIERFSIINIMNARTRKLTPIVCITPLLIGVLAKIFMPH